MKLIFLDIDGVLNNHIPYENGYCGIDDKKIRLLNSLINRTAAQLVISSAWRYMMLKGAMTPTGFHYLLKIHGLTNEGLIHGFTESDESRRDRLGQIEDYVYQHKPEKYVILDDLDLGGNPFDPPRFFVKIDGNRGLVHTDIEKAVDILT